MKSSFAFLSFFLVSVFAFSQRSELGTPLAIAHDLGNPTQQEVLSALDLKQIQLEIAEDEENGNRPKMGKLIPVGFDLDNSGQWEDFNREGRLWRLRIKATGAQATVLYYDDFFIPKGGKLFVYNADRSIVKGAFTEKNNSDKGTFATGLIQGEEVILEYFEPYSAFGVGRISIEEVGNAYRFVPQLARSTRDFGEAGSCQVNVNCSEGDSWKAQRDAAVRILLKIQSDFSWCSGAVINEASPEWKPYILTAMHCGVIEPSNVLTAQADFDQWIFYFKYEAPNCNNPGSEGSLGNNSITGTNVIANSNDQGGNSGSDFLLLELQSDIPANYDPYYAGWDASSSASPSGVGIHHPSGDIKKISTYSSSLVSGSFGGSTPGTHWNVNWVATTNGHGVTEGGSSGSPLFNNSGLIVGDLTGGASFCNSPDQPDEYGKFSYSWESNGTIPEHRLKDWLDPDNTGITKLNGSYRFPTSTPEDLKANPFSVYPNPSSGLITMTNLPEGENNIPVKLIDPIGKTVFSSTIMAAGAASIDLQHLPAGIYLLEAKTADGVLVQKVQILK